MVKENTAGFVPSVTIPGINCAHHISIYPPVLHPATHPSIYKDIRDILRNKI